MLLAKEFSKTADEIQKDHYLLKDTMTLEEAQEYCATFSKNKYESYFIPFNMDADGHTYYAGLYTYKNGKPYKHAGVRIYSYGFGLDEKRFIEDYQGKPIKLVSLMENPHVEEHGQGFIDIVFKTYEDIFNEFDYQNYLTLQFCEQEWLEEPDEHFFD